MKRWPVVVALLMASVAMADTTLQCNGTTQGPVTTLNFVGTTCSRVGSTGTVSVDGGGGSGRPVVGIGYIHTYDDGGVTAITFDGGVGTVTSVSGTAPVASSGGATPVISMTAAGAGVSGYLTNSGGRLAIDAGLFCTSTDPSVFAGSFTSSNLSGTNTGNQTTTGTSPVIVGTGSGNPAISFLPFALPLLNDGGTVGCVTATGSQAGCLTGADWTAFSNKVTSISGTYPVVSSGGSTPAISIRSELGSNNVDGGAIKTYDDGGQNIIDCKVATSSQPGCLSAADWIAFNAKGSGTVTSVTGTSPVISSGGTTPAISFLPFSAPLYNDGGSIGFNGPICSNTQAWTFDGGVVACITASAITTEPFVADDPLLLTDDAGSVGASCKRAGVSQSGCMTFVSGVLFTDAGITSAAVLTGSNLSGTNTGDVTVTSTATGLSVSSQALTLTAAGAGVAGAIPVVASLLTLDAGLYVASSLSNGYAIKPNAIDGGHPEFAIMMRGEGAHGTANRVYECEMDDRSFATPSVTVTFKSPFQTAVSQDGGAAIHCIATQTGSVVGGTIMITTLPSVTSVVFSRDAGGGFTYQCCGPRTP